MEIRAIINKTNITPIKRDAIVVYSGNILIREVAGDLDITSFSEKTFAHNDDLFVIADSQSSYIKKKIKVVRLVDGGQF